MRHGSLFSGIGGFDLAAEWVGWENVFQVEWDKKCQTRLKQNFTNVHLYGNIDEFDGTRYAGRIDVLSGGPPCQPTSSAGKRKGEKDDRWKWPETIRVFGEIRPGVGVFENPDDLLTLDDGEPFERICVSLENFGYKVETYGIPAACVGAWHERDRIWIIAYSDRYTSFNANPNAQGLQDGARSKFGSILETFGTSARSEPCRVSTETGAYWKAEPGVVRVVHGLPDRVDRIKALGNAIVPQVAYEIFKAIDSVLSHDNKSTSPAVTLHSEVEKENTQVRK